ncbi:MAG: adenosylcobinamide-GDP ribazoletransferase [Verrucomicrobia bacterium]|nr:adenosylcobinamide-GDP ribazoletransferase [Verrucomicrobiota bacterium]
MAVLICMLVTICLTGGLHEDGLADSADGLLGGQTLQRRLEIMKDSRIGAYGALALWFSLTAKLILIQWLVEINIVTAIKAVVIAHSLGRTAAVALLAGLSYVRPEDSKSSRFGNRVTLVQFAIGLLFPVILSLLLLRLPGLVCLGTGIVVTLACGFYFRQKIAGITGDCLGATNQLVELGAYIALVMLHLARP